MSELNLREAQQSDLGDILELYTSLHNNSIPKTDETLLSIWKSIIKDPNHHIILGIIGEKIVSSCVIVVIPNLTHEQRPYALIENVITHEDFRNKGYATSVLNAASDIARKANCYKIMLLTGSKQEETLQFYRKAGYNRNDKTAFIQWLDQSYRKTQSVDWVLLF